MLHTMGTAAREVSNSRCKERSIRLSTKHKRRTCRSKDNSARADRGKKERRKGGEEQHDDDWSEDEEAMPFLAELLNLYNQNT